MTTSTISLRVYGNFTIPTNHPDPNEYSWQISVDGKYYGNFHGVSSPNSEGIYLDIDPSTEHRIDILPESSDAAGWGRAFGFSAGDYNANSLLNKARLREVLSDPDYAHAVDNGKFLMPGRNFRREQFSECVNLESTVPESDLFEFRPDGSIIDVTGYRYGMYRNCEKLLVTI
jgi:hypothetical protein